MALTKNDLNKIQLVVGQAIEEVLSPRLQKIEDGLATVEKTQEIEFRKINNRLDKLDVWQSDFRDLVKILASKNVLTTEEAARLHVELKRPAA